MQLFKDFTDLRICLSGVIDQLSKDYFEQSESSLEVVSGLYTRMHVWFDSQSQVDHDRFNMVF